MRRLFAAGFLFLRLSFFLLAADDIELEDFDGAMVYTGTEGSLLSLDFPEEVYRGSRRPDLGDIRIFDAAEQSVPFIVRERPKEMFTPPPERVPFFAWNGGTENHFPGNTDIEINTSGGVLRIKNQSGTPAKSRTFLADLSLLEYTPSTLRVIIDNQGNNFNTTVSVHYSGDLSNWKAFGKKQTLASFTGNGASGETTQDTLELPESGGSNAARYLLLGFGGEAPPPSAMFAVFSPRERPAEYHEAVIRGQRSSDGKKVSYNTESYYPAESVEFALAEADSIQVLIKNRSSEKDEWNILGRETIFRYISAGEVTKNPPFEIASNAPYWELEASGDLLFSSAPDMALRWKPREIIFPGRGKGPWTLAYGSADCAPLEAELRLPGGETDDKTGGNREGFEKARFTGEKRYEKTNLAAPQKNDYRVIILWTFLGAAVIVLFVLAFSIAKSMKK